MYWMDLGTCCAVPLLSDREDCDPGRGQDSLLSTGGTGLRNINIRIRKGEERDTRIWIWSPPSNTKPVVRV